MQDDEIVREFLIESYENLSSLDQAFVKLEKAPKDAELLASIFRTMHTIKGTCGFLAFTTLERIAHHAETLLSQVREGQRDLTVSLTSLIFEAVDAIRTVLHSIEATGQEGSSEFPELVERLREAAQSNVIEEKKPTVPVNTEDVVAPRATAPETEPAAPQQARSDSARQDDPPKEQGPREEAAKSSTVADTNIRVGVGLLDKLMDLVGELVLTRNQILQFNTEREDAALNATSQRLNLITTELQEGVMKTRMQPIGMVWNKLPRVVRDISVSLGKQIRLEMDGAETELDRTIIEAIKDPLVHLVRNSCDHGVETTETRTRVGKPAEGRISLRAYHEGGQVNIEISDDGAGIDVARVKQKAIEKGLLRPEQTEKMSEREAMHLIFLPGFSTAQKITNVSGRGVGMDVVKSHIEKIGGVVDLASHPGQGSTVRIKIPLTLAIIPGLVITSGRELFVIPQVSLLELIRLEGDSQEKNIEYVHGTPVYRRRGSLLPVAYLNQVLGLEPRDGSEVVNMVVLQAEDRQFGLVVDGINDTQEIVVKPLSKQLKGMSVYAGATIMGDGRVALILDVLGIGQRSGVLQESRDQSRSARDQKPQVVVEQQRLLLFKAGSFERLAVPLSLVARLEEFPQSAIERASGGPVVQYRNGILPLVPLRSVLEPGSNGGSTGEPQDPLQAIVFNDAERSVGIVVDQIVDVVEDEITMRQKTKRKGLLGSAVIGKQVADFVDLNYVIQTAAEDWFAGREHSVAEKRVLIAEASPFSRGLIRNGLEMAGYQVAEASDVEGALRRLGEQGADVVVAALNLPGGGSAALLEGMRRRPQWANTPVLGLADSIEQIRSAHAGLVDCQLTFDREAMLESVERLAKALDSSADHEAGQSLSEPEAVLAGSER